MERALVRLPNWLGDVLLARPALHALRRAHPGAALAAVGPAPLLALLATDGLFARAHPWPADGRGRAALARALRAWRPQAALVLPPSFSSALFALRAGAFERVGFAGEGRSLLLTAAVRRPARGELHLSREYLDLAARLGAAPDGPAPPRLAPDPAAAARADAVLAGAGGARVAILGPGALYGPAKRWAPERFAAVGRALAGRGFAVLVCGSAAERPVCEAVARDAGGRALAGATDLPVQAALCARAAIVLCNDSGLAHLAAATGAPTVVIFGSTSSAWTAPLGARVVVQHAPPCSPCFQRTCRIGYRCLAAVTEPEVVRACLAVAA